MIFQSTSILSGGVRLHIAYTTSTQALSGSRGQQGEPGGRAAPPACDPAHAPALASKHPAGTPPRRRRSSRGGGGGAAGKVSAREGRGGRPSGRQGAEPGRRNQGARLGGRNRCAAPCRRARPRVPAQEPAATPRTDRTRLSAEPRLRHNARLLLLLHLLLLLLPLLLHLLLGNFYSIPRNHS